MADEPKNNNEITHHSNRKEWHRPRLRKLPIAATAGATGKTARGDEGAGTSKGDAHTVS